MKQIIIPVPNAPGTLAAVTETLADAGVNIESIEAEAIDDSGVIILRVDAYDTALRALRDGGYRAVTEDALVLRLENRPGALAQIARRLTDAGVGIRSLQILERGDERSLVTLVADDAAAARQVLADEIVALP
ncbi:MAG: ACT domain-containing protein [Verrucomicrobiales bacterium]